MRNPIAIKDLESKILRIRRTGESLSSAKSLSEAFGIETLLVHEEELEPGHRASAPHYHTLKEEIFVVLTGRPSIWQDGVEKQLSPGECIGFSKDDTVARMIVNRTNQPARIMTIGTNPIEDRICYVKESDFASDKAV